VPEQSIKTEDPEQGDKIATALAGVDAGLGVVQVTPDRLENEIIDLTDSPPSRPVNRSLHRYFLRRRLELSKPPSAPSNRLPSRLVDLHRGLRFRPNAANLKKHRWAVRAGSLPPPSCLLRMLNRWGIPCFVKPPRLLDYPGRLQVSVLRPTQSFRRLGRSSSRKRARFSIHPVCCLAASTSPCRSRTRPHSRY
jgi:hypothetical protein